MHIRRLRLDDDDEDGDTVEPPPQPHTSTHQTQTSPNFPPEAVVISDDDFIDVPDDPILPNPPPSFPEPQPSDCPVNDFLRRLGFCLKRDSLADCLRELGSSVNGFQGFDVARKAKLCFEQFLFSDLNFCGSGVLPPNVESMHLDVLPGPYVLQVLILFRSTIELICYILRIIIRIITVFCNSLSRFC